MFHQRPRHEACIYYVWALRSISNIPLCMVRPVVEGAPLVQRAGMEGEVYLAIVVQFSEEILGT